MSYSKPRDLINGGGMKSPEGGENKEKKIISGPEKRGHSPTVSRRIQNPEGFYSKD